MAFLAAIQLCCPDRHGGKVAGAGVCVDARSPGTRLPPRRAAARGVKFSHIMMALRRQPFVATL